MRGLASATVEVPWLEEPITVAVKGPRHLLTHGCARVTMNVPTSGTLCRTTGHTTTAHVTRDAHDEQPHRRGVMLFTPRRSRRLRIIHQLQHRLAPHLTRLYTPDGLRAIRRLPEIPRPLLTWVAPQIGPWPTWTRETPEALRTIAGIRRDEAAEEASFANRKLDNFNIVHRPAMEYILKNGWMSFLPVAPPILRVGRAMLKSRGTGAAPEGGLAEMSPAELTAAVKDLSVEVGLSAVGIAPYDEKYTFAQNQGQHSVGSVIVCLLEQNWKATQSAPSPRAELAAIFAYVELEERALRLAQSLQARGYGAEVHSEAGETMVLHYGVASGLGQLGLNGQLLTPQAGSRCRIVLITTDAPLVSDAPVDYGVERVCDTCQACVRRCPVGAIPANRKLHRGVEKAKINTKRCFPTVAMASGCAICMKVCPVQRYGMSAVFDEFEKSGSILGTGTDELEGYVWPVDGLFYRVGKKPRVGEEITRPHGFVLDLEAPVK